MIRFSQLLLGAAIAACALTLAAAANASTITVRDSWPASISGSAVAGAVVICDGAVQGSGLCGAPGDTTVISAYVLFDGGAATMFEDALYQYDLPGNTLTFEQIAFDDGSFGLDYTPGDAGDPGADGQGTNYHLVTREAPVPEPGTIALLGLGLMGAGYRRRRRV